MGKNLQYYSSKKIFTGTKWLYNKTIVVQKDLIVGIENATNPEHEFIVPAFVDNQIYGASNKLFSVYQNTASLKAYTYIAKKTARLTFCQL